MFICMTQSLEEFIARNSWKYDAIVVEGYDGVGKGRVLEKISEILGVVPYRPDYNLWQKYDHRIIDRWKISGFFWDVFSHFNNSPLKPMLFDRGVISGAVYAEDDRIVKDYKKILRDMRVLHILVTCSLEDYEKYQELRGSRLADYEVCREYTKRYKDYFESAGVLYTIYENKYNEDTAKEVAQTCAGCGHYSYGICRHPDINSKVDKHRKRCRKSNDKEVQDKHDAEMQCV